VGTSVAVLLILAWVPADDAAPPAADAEGEAASPIAPASASWDIAIPEAVSPIARQSGWIFPYAAFNNQPRQIWLEAEYLIWYGKGVHLPPLVTGGPQGSAAVPGEPGVFVAIGETTLTHPHRSGGRFLGGIWLDYDQALGVEAGYLFAGERTVHRTAGAAVRPEAPVLARPFFDVQRGELSSSLVLFPDFRTHLVDVAYSSWFQGTEVSAIINHSFGLRHRWDWLVGFRFLEFQEELRTQQQGKIDRVAPRLGGSRLYVEDELETRNRLLGAHASVRCEACWGPWEVEVLGRVSLGGVEQKLGVEGLTIVDPAADLPEAYYGGFLALPSNSGVHSRWRFAAVPELTARVGYSFWHRCTLYVSYTLVYWPGVLRAADQVDLRINPSQLPLAPVPQGGPEFPRRLFDESTYWIQALGLGLELRF